jgi:hypothetical protein
MVGMCTFGSLDSNLLEALGLLHGPDDSLDQLFNLLVQTTDVGVLFGGLLVDFHGLNSAVVLGRECVENEVRVLVDTDEITGLELFVVDKTNQGEEDGLASRCLDDSRLAYACGIQIDVGTLFGSIFFDVQIEDLDNVSDKVWELTGWIMLAGSGDRSKARQASKQAGS